MRGRTITIKTSLAALLLAALTGCTPPGQDEEVEFYVPVFVREVETGDVEDRIVATGSLRAAEGVVLRADTGGALIVARGPDGRRLAEGDRVEAGQTIAEVTGEEVRLAAATEATYQRYKTAQRDFDSQKELFESGLLSEQQFRQAEATLADAKLEWERSRFTENRSRLVTPIAGLILRLVRDDQGLPMADGQLITQGSIVAQVAPTGDLVADVDLVGPDVGRVAEGMAARVRHHAWEERTFHGEVVRLAPSLDVLTRTLRAEVSVTNDEGRLRPGMFVEVTMIALRREEVLVVPREAVTERGGRKVVFVLKGQRVEQRDVVLGLGDDEIVEIRQGVETGDRVVVRGLETLTDEARVRVSGA
jgi:RND family efflux transporter MFP subunit